MKLFFQAVVLFSCVVSIAQAGPLMSKSKEARLRKFFPKVEDAELQAVLSDPDLILYTEQEMPKAYQIWDGAFQGVHSANYNISAGASEAAKGNGAGGNGNIEFPWTGPGGTHRSSGVYAFRFLKLPKRNGKTLPVVWFRQRLQGDASLGYAWMYPIGTVFGEVLAMRGPDGRHYTFEIRTRTRLKNAWEPNVLRPFPTVESLAQRIKELRPTWQKQPDLVKLVRHLEEPRLKMAVARLADLNHPGKREFDQRVARDYLPTIKDARLISELLLKTPFQTAHGEVWRMGASRLLTYAPTTKAAWHVVPKNYDAAFIAVDQQSCARCHSSVNSHVDRFDAGRDWYGRVRGSDRIFSFHPFSLGSISNNGFPRSISMRGELVQRGLLAQYNPGKHKQDAYRRIAVE